MKHKIGLIFIISATLLFTNCLTMTYHSPRVVEPDVFQIGAGISGIDYMGQIDFPELEVFMKYGMYGGFDFGVHLNTYYLPDGIGLSVKKQFDMNQPYIDAVNFEYGMIVNGFIPYLVDYGGFYTGINLVKNNFAVQMRMQKDDVFAAIALIGDPLMVDIVYNKYMIAMSYEISLNNHNVLLFIRGEYQNKYRYENGEYETFERNAGIGGGISYYFNIR